MHVKSEPEELFSTARASPVQLLPCGTSVRGVSHPYFSDSPLRAIPGPVNVSASAVSCSMPYSSARHAYSGQARVVERGGTGTREIRAGA